MNSFVKPEIAVYDINPQVDIDLGVGGHVSGVPE